MTNRFHSKSTEYELGQIVLRKKKLFEKALEAYVKARVELEAQREINSGVVPNWALKNARNQLSANGLIEMIISQSVGTKAKYEYILNKLHEAGSKIQNDSLSARLNKMKREGKIKRVEGHWMLTK